MLTLNDLDFESNDPRKTRQSHQQTDLQEAITEIRQVRESLGKFTLRDTMEAVYGTAYTVSVLGQEGGKDVLVEELSAVDEVRALHGKNRAKGTNSNPVQYVDDMDASQRSAARAALAEQEAVAEQAAVNSMVDGIKEDGKRHTASPAQKVVEDISNMLPEERAEIIRLLQAAGASK